MKKTPTPCVTTDSIFEALGHTILFVVFLCAWIASGSLIVAILMTFLALIPMAAILIPLALITEFILWIWPSERRAHADG
jgi:hypothetical protein